MDEIQLAKALNTYEELLIKFNKKLNLISRDSIKNVNENHIQDSLNLVKYMKSLDKIVKCHDFGSGNGLPGIVYALSAPDTEVILVEKDQRKSQFLKHVATTLKADNISIWSQLAEDIRPTAISGICRAFLPMSKALPIWNKICLPGSIIYMMKSVDWMSELDNVNADSWSFEAVKSYSLMSGTIPRVIVKATKL